MTTTTFFTSATMWWADKSTIIYHRKYSHSQYLEWTVDPANCLQNGHNHSFLRSAWRFSSYNPTPTGATSPTGMSATLTLSLDGMTDLEKQDLEQHFIDKRQLTLTVYFNLLRPQALYLNLRSK